MVILDNATRWNSTALSLERALQLKNYIILFYLEDKDINNADKLSDDDWEVLTELHDAIEPFRGMTRYLESRAFHAHHGSVWETLPTLECLMGHMEALKTKYRNSTSEKAKSMKVMVNCAWVKLEEYYKYTDDVWVGYAFAKMLHPVNRMNYFNKNWTNQYTSSTRSAMEDACHTAWKKDYLSKKTAEPPVSERPVILLESYLAKHQETITGNEFTQYSKGTPTQFIDIRAHNPIEWWTAHKEQYPTLHLAAYDYLSIPAMSSECERVFSSVGRLITPVKNAYNDDIVEAIECLKYWWDNNLIVHSKPRTEDLEDDDEIQELHR